MQISTSRLPMQAPKAVAAPAPKQEAEAAPSDSFTFSPSAGGHYSGGKVIMRAAGGAITGLLASHPSAG